MTVSHEKTIVLQHYEEVKHQIIKSCSTAHRCTESVKLIVISKFQPAAKIHWLLEAGQRDFGESRVEEMQEKWEPILSAYPDVRLHYIGQIQSRKIPNIVKYSHVVHSLDRIEIAEKIANESIKQNKMPECLIQVNIGAELQKAGVDPAYFPVFLGECQKINSLAIKGIMCIPPLNQDPVSYFQSMYKLKMEFNLDELSMGMSNDYEDAVKCGATMLRIGTKIMGVRSD